MEKHREGSRWVRKHDQPRTAYQRVIDSGQLDGKAKRALQDRHEALDPFELGNRVENELKKILR